MFLYGQSVGELNKANYWSLSDLQNVEQRAYLNRLELKFDNFPHLDTPEAFQKFMQAPEPRHMLLYERRKSGNASGKMHYLLYRLMEKLSSHLWNGLFFHKHAGEIVALVDCNQDELFDACFSQIPDVGDFPGVFTYLEGKMVARNTWSDDWDEDAFNAGKTPQTRSENDEGSGGISDSEDKQIYGMNVLRHVEKLHDEL